MRSVSVALAALIGVVAANPLAEWPRNAPPPYPTGVTTSKPDTITYTTETICPVTYTHGTEVKTTLTTSTITVTSCKGGCHKPTPPPVYTPPPHGGDHTITKTYTTITYTFVPCSTSVGNNDHSVIYSTYLSQSAITKTYTTYEVVKPTPAPPAITPTPEAPKPGTCPPTVTTITQIIDNFSCPPAPPAVTSTVTVTVGKPPAPPCHECVKSYTVTEGDFTTCITYTYEVPPTKSTVTPVTPGSKPPYTKPTTPVSTPPVYTLPPHGTGKSSSSIPKPTGGYYTKGW
jgi:hypothetical protein